MICLVGVASKYCYADHRTYVFSPNPYHPNVDLLLLFLGHHPVSVWPCMRYISMFAGSYFLTRADPVLERPQLRLGE